MKYLFKILNNFRSHFIRSIVLYDEKGNPRNNLEFKQNQSVEIVFDMVPDYLQNQNTDENSSLFNQRNEGEEDLYDKEFQCAFWDPKKLDWSSDGCEVVNEDMKHIGNIHPIGIRNKFISLRTRNYYME